MAETNDKPLFFASDSEDEKGMFQSMNAEAVPQSRADEPTEASKDFSKKRLFFASSDDEHDPEDSDINVLLNRRGLISSSSSVVVSSPFPRASSVTSIRSSSPPPIKRRKGTTPVVKHSNDGQTRSTAFPSVPLSAGFESVYLGSFLVPNAWSTSKGSGWVKVGEEIFIKRNEDEASSTSSTKSNSTKAKAEKKPVPGKQLKLTSMMKVKNKVPAPQNLKKTKVDNVVRFTNSRGFEIGRLPQNVASWAAKLLDQGIIVFKGCTMIDCAQNLHTGDDMLIQLRVYILAKAFVQRQFPRSSDDARPLFNEGQETLEEQHLRERKAALTKLFEAIDLKPTRFNAIFGNLKSRVGMLDKKTENDISARVDKGKKKAVDLDDQGAEDENEAEILSEDQLDLIYRKAQKNDRTMAEMEPADTFTLTLRPYQKQALLWMQSLESGTASARDTNSMHPLWEEYTFPYEQMDDGTIDLTKEQKPFYFNPYSGELSLIFPRFEKKCRGGILADVGMGKTIMISSLLHTSREPEPLHLGATHGTEEASTTTKPRQLKLDATFRPIANSSTESGLSAPFATLIVAPTSLMSQWASELERSSQKGNLNVIVWHGNNRDDLEDIFDDETKINVVITSYGVVGSEWVKHDSDNRQGSPLYQMEWMRVVLDEAHNCKSRMSRAAKACCALKARRRWALTGTPIVNKLEDLYSLLKFLDFTPWSDYAFFRSFITLPFLHQDPQAVEIVQVILESVLLRREKTMRDRDGKRIVELPAKEITVQHLEFSPMERKIYDSLYIDAKKKFERLKAKGLVGKNYTHILAMLMRLRQAVLHPSLVQVKGANEKPVHGEGPINVDSLIAKFADEENGTAEGTSNVFAEGVLTRLEKSYQEECAVCFDVMDLPVLVPDCLHSCCKRCAVAFLQSCKEKGEEGHCPICRRGPVKESQLLEVIRHKSAKKMDVSNDDGFDGDRASSPAVVLRQNNFTLSTKLNALSEDLRRLRDQDPCFRAVVFSQFTSFLDLIAIVLRRDRFAFHRFDGTMNVKDKAAAVEEFIRPSRSGKVFIVSLKAGGVGLNLTAADHVYMMDCWWNAAIEDQAIDRVHRIGQERTVHVKQFIISHTIEERILKIQKRKTAIVKGALSGKGEDVDSMENLKIMFGEL